MRNKVVRWFEPLGLLLLLAAFGWQCWEEYSNQTKVKGYIYELSHMLSYRYITKMKIGLRR